MSAIEEVVAKPEVSIVHRQTTHDPNLGESHHYDLYMGEKKVGEATQRPGIASAAIRYGDASIGGVVVGIGDTIPEAIHEVFTNGIAAKQRDVDALKALAFDYGDQLALAASHLEDGHVR